jgi:hypothetical protein
VVNWNRISYQLVTHTVHSLQAPKRYSTYWRQEGKRLFIHIPIAWLSIPSQYSLWRQIHQWLGSRKASHSEKREGILDKNEVSRSTFKQINKRKAYWTRTKSRGQPRETVKNLFKTDDQQNQVVEDVVHCRPLAFHITKTATGQETTSCGSTFWDDTKSANLQRGTSGN